MDAIADVYADLKLGVETQTWSDMMTAKDLDYVEAPQVCRTCAKAAWTISIRALYMSN